MEDAGSPTRLKIGVGIQVLAWPAVVLDPTWTDPDAGWIVTGEFFGEVFGNSLFEEVLYRGLLLPQVYFYFTRAGWIRDEKKRWTAALFLSQGLFAVMHLPNRIASGYALGDLLLNQLVLLGLGFFFAICYALTGNLAVAIGLHALNNVAVTILVPVMSQFLLLLPIGVVVCGIAWRFRTRDSPTGVTGSSGNIGGKSS